MSLWEIPEGEMDGNVTASERIAFLRAEMDRQRQQFVRRRRRDKRKAFVLQMATVTLSAAITVLLGLRVGTGTQRVLANVALTLGALVALLAAMEAFFNHRGLWVSRTVTLRRFEELRRRIDYRLAELSDHEVEPTAVDRLLTELNEILADDQRAWMQLRSVDAPSPKTTKGHSPSSRQTHE
jgi:hypothetical protein